MAIAMLIASPLPAPLECYKTDCLPSVKKLEGTTPAPCPREFRAKNYAMSSDNSEWAWKTVCAEAEDSVYGGLSFYAGEGVTGTGGLLRLDKKSRAVEVRRLPLLRDVSVNSITAEGDVVWFGTTSEGECVGEPFVHGLVRYNWRTREIATYEGTDDGPIGFVINDLQLSDHSLWVATDLGISRLDRDANTWHHPGERSASAMLTELLRKTPRDCLRSDSFENQLVEGLAKFRPRFLEKYLLSRPEAEWQKPEILFLATRKVRISRRLASHLKPMSPDADATVFALEKTTKQRIEPDGTISRAPSSTFKEFRRHWWHALSPEQRDAVMAAWPAHILRQP